MRKHHAVAAKNTVTTKKAVRLDDLPELLTPEEAATVLRISRNGMYDMLRRGDVPSVKFGRLIRIRKAALLEGE